MTRLHPEDRPSKEQVARDLTAWQQLASKPPVLDVAEARSGLRAKLASAIAEQDTKAQRKELALAAVRRLQDLTAPLNHALKDLWPGANIDSSTDQMTTNLLRSRSGRRTVQFRWHRCTIVAPLEGPRAMTLRMSRSLELVDDGSLLLHLMVHVGPEGVMGTDYNWHRPVASAPVSTVEAERMLEDGVLALTDALKDGIAVLVDKLPDASSA